MRHDEDLHMKTWDLHLHLDFCGDRLSVHAEVPRVGTATHRPEKEQLVGLGNLSGNLAYGSGHGMDWAEAAGRQVFGVLCGGLVEPLLRETQARARASGGVVRWVLKYDLTGADADGRVHEVPWELAFDGERDRFVALDDETLFMRHLRGAGDTWEPVQGPLRVLLSSACPMGADALGVDREILQLRQMMAGLAGKGRVRIHELPALGGRRLVQEFNHARVNDRPFHVWHHCGHGRLDESGRAAGWASARG